MLSRFHTIKSILKAMGPFMSRFCFAGLPFPYLVVMVTEMGRQKMTYDNGQKLNILGVERCSEGDGEQDGCALVQYEE
ncbi:hypothetical protein OUZ56_002485 [Daphnia magna]|uniref:Uncharacterized protein n=2 Tax=Daphnia magna TaxID=35525 RepID=A0ABR0A5V7_9CRUS|nr:hypothetical protein OUZ56_002485 [Daphnia magna]